MSRRILFVDDEPRVLEGIENLMFPFMDDWDMVFAESGKEALSVLEQDPVDVLVTDMQMPGMNGATLLERVKDAHPGIVRIVLSGHAEVEAALHAMPMAHQFLSKPCGANTLTSVLDQAQAIHALVDSALLRNMLGNVTTLPASPQTQAQLQPLLAADDWQPDAIATRLECDIAMAAKVIQVANTAFFSRGEAIATVTKAIHHLGPDYTRTLLAEFETYGNLDAVVVDRLNMTQRQSRWAAHLTQRLVREELRAHAFLAGLFHSVGSLGLAAARPDAFAEATSRAMEEKISWSEAERSVLGLSHAEAGAYLLGLWGLPRPIIEAVALQHAPNDAETQPSELASALHIAAELIRSATHAQCPEFKANDLRRLGIEATIPALQTLANETLETYDDRAIDPHTLRG